MGFCITALFARLGEHPGREGVVSVSERFTAGETCSCAEPSGYCRAATFHTAPSAKRSWRSMVPFQLTMHAIRAVVPKFTQTSVRETYRGQLTALVTKNAF